MYCEARQEVSQVRGQRRCGGAAKTHRGVPGSTRWQRCTVLWAARLVRALTDEEKQKERTPLPMAVAGESVAGGWEARSKVHNRPAPQSLNPDFIQRARSGRAWGPAGKKKVS